MEPPLCANPQEVREGTSAVGQASSPNSGCRHKSSPHLGATVPGSSWRVGSLLFSGSLKSQRAPSRQAHLQGGTLQACTIHCH